MFFCYFFLFFVVLDTGPALSSSEVQGLHCTSASRAYMHTASCVADTHSLHNSCPQTVQESDLIETFIGGFILFDLPPITLLSKNSFGNAQIVVVTVSVMMT